jgi:hypothetical protein
MPSAGARLDHELGNVMAEDPWLRRLVSGIRTPTQDYGLNINTENLLAFPNL